MAYKELVIYLFILNAIAMTRSQVINYQHDRCNNDVDKDLFLLVRELQLELSVSEGRLQGQITQLKEKLAEYKDKQSALENELRRQGNEFISFLVMTSYNQFI